MARLARVVLPGHPHHVTQRGVRALDIFAGDDDRNLYLQLLAEQSARAGVEILAWCLMSNHVHLIAVPREAQSLARAVGEAHRRYAQQVNIAQGLRGHLFQERFFSCLLDEQHLVGAIRYLERNPVRAGLARRVGDYAWSSARYHLGLRQRDPLVRERRPFGLNVNWRKLLEMEPAEIEALRRATRTGWPLADENLARQAETVLRRRVRKMRPGPRPGSRIWPPREKHPFPKLSSRGKE